MTITTPTRPEPPVPRAGGPTGPAPLPSPAVTTGRVLRSELVKLSSLRSVWAAVLVTALTIIAMGVITTVGTVVQSVPPDGADTPSDPVGGALAGISLAVYPVAALGVLAVTSEYASGTIKATLSAVPRRPLLVRGKVLALVSVTFLVTLVSSLTAFLASAAVLAADHQALSLTDPGAFRAVAGAAGYLTGVGLLASASAWLLRSTAGSLAALFGVLVMLPPLAMLLPSKVATAVIPYLPDTAGQALMQTMPGDLLPPLAGLAVFALYVVLALAGATALLQRRDA